MRKPSLVCKGALLITLLGPVAGCGSASNGNPDIRPPEPLLVTDEEDALYQTLSDEERWVEGQLLVKVQESGIFDRPVIHEILGTSFRERAMFRDGHALENLRRLEGIELSGRSMSTIARLLSEVPGIEYAEPNYLLRSHSLPNDPFFTSEGSWGQTYEDMWGLRRLEPAEAWDMTEGDGIVVAVVDSGVDLQHPDLQNRLWRNPMEIANNGVDDDGNGLIDDLHGYDFYNGDSNPDDPDGHGTHVAGIIAAEGNNGLGVVGLAPRARIMAIRSLNGSGPAETLAQGIVYAADNGASIINNSWGGALSSQIIADAIAYAHSRDVVLVASAGNDYTNVAITMPANLPEVIAVASTNESDERSAFSNWGLGVDISTPGGATDDSMSVLATLAGDSYLERGYPELTVAPGYIRLGGTSMASPFASGVAALIRGAFPNANAEEVRGRMIASADPTGREFYGLLGGGRANARNAVAIAPRPHFLVRAAELVEEDGDGDGIAETGETARVVIELENVWRDSTGVTATLDVEEGPIVGIEDPTVDLGTFGMGERRILQAWVVSLEEGFRYEFYPAFKATLMFDGHEQVVRFRTDAGIRKYVDRPLSDRILDVWDHLVLHTDEERDLFIDNLETGERTEVPDAEPPVSLAAISGNIVTWYTSRNTEAPEQSYQFKYHDFATGETTEILPPGNGSYFNSVDVSGNRIAYGVSRFPIQVLDLATGQTSEVPNSIGTRFVEMDGDLITWAGGRVYDFRTGEERTYPFEGFSEAVHISGRRLAWRSNNDGDRALHIVNLDTDEEEVSLETIYYWDFDIHGNRLIYAWQEPSSLLGWHYYLVERNLDTGVEQRITTHLAHSRLPRSSARYVVWQDYRLGGTIGWAAGNIYGVPRVDPDETAPSTPAVEVEADSTSSEIAARCTSRDDESEIIEYEYSIGLTEHTLERRGWTSVGSASSFAVDPNDVPLAETVTYYIRVRARNDAGLWSEVGHTTYAGRRD